MRILVFVSSNCAHCPLAESVVKEVVPDYSSKELSYEKIRTKTVEGKDLSIEYYIQGVPTLLFLDDENNEIERIVGTPSEEKLRKKIDKLLGLRKPFLSKLLKK